MVRARHGSFCALWRRDSTHVFLLTRMHTHIWTVLEKEIPELTAEELNKLKQFDDNVEDAQRFGQV